MYASNLAQNCPAPDALRYVLFPRGTLSAGIPACAESLCSSPQLWVPRRLQRTVAVVVRWITLLRLQIIVMPGTFCKATYPISEMNQVRRSVSAHEALVVMSRICIPCTDELVLRAEALGSSASELGGKHLRDAGGRSRRMRSGDIVRPCEPCTQVSSAGLPAGPRRRIISSSVMSRICIPCADRIGLFGAEATLVELSVRSMEPNIFATPGSIRRMGR